MGKETGRERGMGYNGKYSQSQGGKESERKTETLQLLIVRDRENMRVAGKRQKDECVQKM